MSFSVSDLFWPQSNWSSRGCTFSWRPYTPPWLFWYWKKASVPLKAPANRPGTGPVRIETFETVIELPVTPTSVLPPLSPEKPPLAAAPDAAPDLPAAAPPVAPDAPAPPLAPAATPASLPVAPPSPPVRFSLPAPPAPPLRPDPNASNFWAVVVRDPHAAVASARVIPSTTSLDLRIAPPECGAPPGNLTGRRKI